jgi:hypothetical protein
VLKMRSRSRRAVSAVSARSSGLDVNAGIVSLLQTLRSFVRLLEQQGVPLWPSGALSDEPKHCLTRIDCEVSKPPAEDLSSHSGL